MEILFYKNIIILNFYNFFFISDIQLNISFLFDSLSIIMLFVILSISTFVHIFTISYMSHDPFIIRFYTYLGLFTFFMIVLVTSDNFLQLFIG
jgi:NADH-quinone oxidoreductase subunit L